MIVKPARLVDAKARIVVQDELWGCLAVTSTRTLHGKRVQGNFRGTTFDNISEDEEDEDRMKRRDSRKPVLCAGGS